MRSTRGRGQSSHILSQISQLPEPSRSTQYIVGPKKGWLHWLFAGAGSSSRGDPGRPSTERKTTISSRRCRGDGGEARPKKKKRCDSLFFARPLLNTQDCSQMLFGCSQPPRTETKARAKAVCVAVACPSPLSQNDVRACVQNGGPFSHSSPYRIVVVPKFRGTNGLKLSPSPTNTKVWNVVDTKGVVWTMVS